MPQTVQHMSYCAGAKCPLWSHWIESTEGAGNLIFLFFECTPALSTGQIKRNLNNTWMNVPFGEIIQVYQSSVLVSRPGYKQHKQNNPGNLSLRKVFAVRDQISCRALNSRNHWSVIPFRTLFYTFAKSWGTAQGSWVHLIGWLRLYVYQGPWLTITPRLYLKMEEMVPKQMWRWCSQKREIWMLDTGPLWWRRSRGWEKPTNLQEV